MKNIDFQKMLFRSAVSVMAVDGNISDTEVQELTNIVKTTAYFFDFDYDEELKNNIAEIRQGGKIAINKYLADLSTCELSEKQELILVEVLLRMIEADNEVAPNELKFFQLVKSKLKTPEEILITKFPRQIEYFVDSRTNGNDSDFETEIILN